jgi:uncharacterized membrane protein YsdA (DUF1294 family)/cold shock CspA family protein
MRPIGKITHWNEEKGYGFITPSSGADRVFVHIRAFKNRHLLPELNQVVLYSLSNDKQGRNCSVKVTRAIEKLPGKYKTNVKLFPVLLAIGFMVFVGWSVLAYNMPRQVLYLYLAVSVFTFLVYLKDKRAARIHRWRSKESTLLTLALFGGWPGALIAQQMLRHKTAKMNFQMVFWLTVVANFTVFGWLMTNEGKGFIRPLIEVVYRNIPF